MTTTYVTMKLATANHPLSGKFQKGRSGNPSGRPRKRRTQLDPAAVLEAIDNETVTVLDNGMPRQMSKAKIGVRQLLAKATKGDLKAARLVANMAARYFAPETLSSGEMEVISEPEAEKRFGRNWQEHLRA